MSGKRIVFQNQIELPEAAENTKSPIRKQEFDIHINATHLPAGGEIGQVLVMTSTGLAWKYPKVMCSCGLSAISFHETVAGTLHQQGIDFNAVREVEIV